MTVTKNSETIPTWVVKTVAACLLTLSGYGAHYVQERNSVDDLTVSQERQVREIARKQSEEIVRETSRTLERNSTKLQEVLDRLARIETKLER